MNILWHLSDRFLNYVKAFFINFKSFNKFFLLQRTTLRIRSLGFICLFSKSKFFMAWTLKLLLSNVTREGMRKTHERERKREREREMKT